MKKTCKTLLMMAALVLGLLIFTDTSEAKISGLKQSGANTSSVVIEWDAVASGSGCVYQVWWGYSQDSLTGKFSAGGRVSATLTGLNAGKTIYVQVIAYDNYDYSTEVDRSDVVAVGTKPKVGEVTGLAQTNATANSISMSWTAVSGATGYDVYRYNAYNDYTKLGSTTATSYTVSGLAASQQIRYFVIAYAVTPVGLRGESIYYTAVSMKTAPAAVPAVKMTNFWDSLNTARYGWTKVNNADGYELQLLDKKGKSLLKVERSGSTDYYDHTPIYKNKFVQCRVRAYVLVGNKKVYGAYSPSEWNASAKKVTVKRVSKKKKIKVTWSKISGISKYKISISTQKDGGYKKVKSLGSKKTSYTITKCGKKKIKKGKTYYIRIKYLTKVDGESITSRIYAQSPGC